MKDGRGRGRPSAARRGVVRRLDPAPAAVCLTFDDGPDPEHTPRVLDLLAEKEATATFFVIGSEAGRHPRLLRRALREGHGVASHSWSHRHPWLLSPRGAQREVGLAARTIEDSTGIRPRWFRPPHGRLTAALADAAFLHGQRIALWSRSAIDWGPWGGSGAVLRRLLQVEPGDIVLLHDGRRRWNRPASALHAVVGLLEDLRRRGLRTVRLEEAPSAGRSEALVRRSPAPASSLESRLPERPDRSSREE